MKNMHLILAQAQDGEDVQVLTGDQAQEGQTQETTQQDGTNGTESEPQTQGPGFGGNMIFILVIFAIVYFLMIRGPKKRQQEHTKMVSSLKKNDRIRTIGGIYGTVLDVKDKELTIKIDENTNTKVKVSPGAVAEVISEKGENK